MQIFLNKQTLRVAMVIAMATGGVQACSSARLDSDTKAFTFDAPVLEGSATPTTSVPPVTGTAPTPKAGVAAASNAAPVATAPEAPQSQTCSRLPDPKASFTSDWLRLTVHYEKGKLSLVRSQAERTRQPESTARKMGRFAAELWIGCELIDRVRFDFPLLATEPVKQDPKNPHHPDFEEQGKFDTSILVPNNERATRLELRDRAHEDRLDSLVTLPWPIPRDLTLLGAPQKP